MGGDLDMVKRWGDELGGRDFMPQLVVPKKIHLATTTVRDENRRGLLCIYSNLRSIINHGKRDELSVIIDQKIIDILGITESWAHKEILNAELNLHTYTLFRKDRISGVKKCGGAVILYVINSLTSLFPISTYETMATSRVETYQQL